ncbi:MAG: response regulator, partial [Desulfobacterales bacterium]|nr:response regulator [Desulfobacterales bacterium]
ILEKMLDKFNYTAVLTSDGEAAIRTYQIALAKNASFDLTILDLTVPGGMGGKEAAEQILKLDPNAKIIFSTGNTNDPMMSEYKKIGIFDILPKPFRLENLIEKVRQATHL